VRIRSCPQKSRRKHFELDIVVKRGWEGQEFDRNHPRKAALILTSPTELEALAQEHEEVRQAMQALSSEKTELLTDGTQTDTDVGQTPVEGVVEQQGADIGAEQR
jgi:hypothetical protein